MVDDHGEELQGTSVADLVHPNDLQAVEQRRVPLLIGDACRDSSGGLPTDVEVFGGGRLVGVLEKPCDLVLECPGEERAGPRPRRVHRPDSAPAAEHPVHVAADVDPEPENAQLPPSPELALGSVKPNGLTVAFAASKAPPGRSDLDFDGRVLRMLWSLVAESDALHHRLHQTQGFLKESSWAHVPSSRSTAFFQIRSYEMDGVMSPLDSQPAPHTNGTLPTPPKPPQCQRPRPRGGSRGNRRGSLVIARLAPQAISTAPTALRLGWPLHTY